MFQCTKLVLPAGTTARKSPRSISLQQPGYANAFDANTLFYDVIALPPPHNYLLFIGPPFFNLWSTFFQARLNGHQVTTLRSSYFPRDHCCDVWIPNWESRSVTLDTNFGSFDLSPQPSAHHLYAGKRVKDTLSKDNQINWIIDWIMFHTRNHGADAVLIYDNDSSLYTGQTLEETLRAAFPELEINVVHWPYIFGPQGQFPKIPWDSSFCPFGALQDARFRFLASALSVLNCDIDEFVVCPQGTSVFDATENSSCGYLMFKGSWISSALLDMSINTDLQSDRKHGQFVFLESDNVGQCPPKWCVVPSRCQMDHDWTLHTVIGMESPAAHCHTFSYRHFRSISINWKYQRHLPMPFDKQHHQFDVALARSFDRADIPYYQQPQSDTDTVRVTLARGNRVKKSNQFLSLTSPMRITLMGNSVVTMKNGYTKHLMEVLNALVSDGASH